MSSYQERNKDKYDKTKRDQAKGAKNAGASALRPKYTFLQPDDLVAVKLGPGTVATQLKLKDIEVVHAGMVFEVSARIGQEHYAKLMESKLAEAQAETKRVNVELVKLRKMVSDNSKKLSETKDLTLITSEPVSWADTPVEPVEATEISVDDF